MLTLFTLCNAINLDEDIQSYINNLVVEFQNSPRESRFGSVIALPLCLTAIQKGKFLLPKVFMWSPCQHFEFKVECPLHKGVKLKPWQWTKDVYKKQKRKSARLAHDLHGNVVLVQRIYVCVRGRLCYKLMSATPDVMNALPNILQEYFPFILTEKSGYTKTLADYTEAQLLQGVNFLKISEGIASLSIREFCRQKELYAAAIGDSRSNSNVMKISMSQFYQNSLFSYPSNDILMNMFLKSFKACSHLCDGVTKHIILLFLYF